MTIAVYSLKSKATKTKKIKLQFSNKQYSIGKDYYGKKLKLSKRKKIQKKIFNIIFFFPLI